jgi:hypothetical protein
MCSCVLCLLFLTAYQCAPEHDGTSCRLGCSSMAVPFPKPTGCIRGMKGSGKLFLDESTVGITGSGSSRYSRAALKGVIVRAVENKLQQTKSCHLSSRLAFVFVFIQFSPLRPCLCPTCSGSLRVNRIPRNDIRPANQSPMLLNSPAKRNLLSNFRTRRTRQVQLCRIGLHAHDFRSRSC